MVSTITKIDDDLWTVDQSIPIEKGLLPCAIPTWLDQMPVRMTILRLSNRKLFIHSPVSPEPLVLDFICSLGQVEHVVSPNAMHTQFILPYAELFPHATAWVAPNPRKRRAGLEKLRPMSDASPLAPQDLKQQLVQGHHGYETAFFHPQTRTLIVADLAYNIIHHPRLLGRLYMTLFRAYGQFALPIYHRFAVLDRVQLRHSFDMILHWNFERVIMSHGEILHQHGRENFERIWKWV